MGRIASCAMRSTTPFHIVEDSRYQEHQAPPGHPERPERLVAVTQALDTRRPELESRPPRQASPDEILRVHDARHLARIERAASEAPGQLDADTFISPASHEVARLAAGATIDLALAIAAGEARTGLSAVRPPGHHAEADRPLGFCLFNNVAIAARALQAEAGVDRVLILDWDVHHGNGTQHSFEADPSVLFLSLHQSPHYPGTGDFGEAGREGGLGATLNVPLPAGCGDAEYLAVMERVFVPVAEQFAPEMILVSCGFDAHRDDPLGGMNLTGAGYRAMTETVRAVADQVCGGRACFVLEGGYAASGLIEGTLGLLEGMLDEPGSSPECVLEAPNPGLAPTLARVGATHGTLYPALASL